MKKWCEECCGRGIITNAMPIGECIKGIVIGETKKCDSCNGKGYTDVNPYDKIWKLINNIVYFGEIDRKREVNNMIHKIAVICKGEDYENLGCEYIEEQENKDA